jgi:hypothetical protein
VNVTLERAKLRLGLAVLKLLRVVDRVATLEYRLAARRRRPAELDDPERHAPGR